MHRAALEDLDFFFENLESVHPRVDYRMRLDEYSREKKYCYALCEEVEEEAELYDIIQAFLHKFGDAHTHIGSPSSTTQRRVAPVTSTLIEGKVVVDKIIAGEDVVKGVSRGDILLAVDGMDIETVLQLRLRSSSSNNQDWGRKMAAREVLCFDAPDSPDAQVVVGKPSGEVRAEVVPLMNPDKLQQTNGYIDDHLRPFWFSFREDLGAGVFSFRRCFDRAVCRQSSWWLSELQKAGKDLEDVPDMEETCNQFFSELQSRGYSRMILDLRGNSGGNSSVGQLLFKYITKRDLTSYGCEVKLSRLARDNGLSFPDTDLGSIRKYDNQKLKYPYHSYLPEPEQAALQPFHGKVFVLIDTDVFSSGEWLAAELRANNIGVFVGEPTGGGGSVPGDQLSFTLPHSRMKVHVSCKLFTMPGSDQYPGVLPDYYVAQTLTDFRASHDTGMQYIADLIRTRLG